MGWGRGGAGSELIRRRRGNKETPLNCTEAAQKFLQAVAGVEKVGSFAGEGSWSAG